MLGNPACSPVEPSSQPASIPREDFDLFLLIGQSNMAGRAKVETQDMVADPRVLVLDTAGNWASQGEPVHFDKPESVGLGPALSFAKAVAAASPGKTIGLIPCAVGSTALDRWEKSGDLYKAAVLRCLQALRHGRLQAILWHQGESDSGEESPAKTYGDRLARMVADLRTDLQSGDVLFLAGQLADFVTTRSDTQFPYARSVNDGICRLPVRLARIRIVSSAGLSHRGDTVHFDGPGARELGRRYAEAYLSSRGSNP